MKERIKVILKPYVIIPAFVFIILVYMLLSFYTVKQDEYGVIMQLGQIVNIKNEPGAGFKIPLIQNVRKVPNNVQFYDIPISTAYTSDKKAFLVNCYTSWQIEDPKLFIQTINTIPAMEAQLDAAIYNAVKNMLGKNPQDSIIGVGDSTNRDTVNQEILFESNRSVKVYGAKIVDAEIKALDVPSDNEQAIYARMISERDQIAAELTANGQLEAAKIINTTNANVTEMIGKAEKEVERLTGETEKEYMQVLASAYDTTEKMEFYKFIRTLEAMEKSFLGSQKRTIILSRDSDFVKMLMSQ